jgi:hypothetical protein
VTALGWGLLGAVAFIALESLVVGTAAWLDRRQQRQLLAEANAARDAAQVWGCPTCSARVPLIHDDGKFRTCLDPRGVAQRHECGAT